MMLEIQPRRDWIILSPTSRPATVWQIQKAVAAYNNISVETLIGRARQHSFARQLAIWLTRELLPDLSLPQIGKAFKRDHTTVLYAWRSMDARMAGRSPEAVWLELQAHLGD